MASSSTGILKNTPAIAITSVEPSKSIEPSNPIKEFAKTSAFCDLLLLLTELPKEFPFVNCMLNDPLPLGIGTPKQKESLEKIAKLANLFAKKNTTLPPFGESLNIGAILKEGCLSIHPELSILVDFFANPDLVLDEEGPVNFRLQEGNRFLSEAFLLWKGLFNGDPKVHQLPNEFFLKLIDCSYKGIRLLRFTAKHTETTHETTNSIEVFTSTSINLQKKLNNLHKETIANSDPSFHPIITALYKMHSLVDEKAQSSVGSPSSFTIADQCKNYRWRLGKILCGMPISQIQQFYNNSNIPKPDTRNEFLDELCLSYIEFQLKTSCKIRIFLPSLIQQLLTSIAESTQEARKNHNKKAKKNFEAIEHQLRTILSDLTQNISYYTQKLAPLHSSQPDFQTISSIHHFILNCDSESAKKLKIWHESFSENLKKLSEITLSAILIFDTIENKTPTIFAVSLHSQCDEISTYLKELQFTIHSAFQRRVDTLLEVKDSDLSFDDILLLIEHDSSNIDLLPDESKDESPKSPKKPSRERSSSSLEKKPQSPPSARELAEEPPMLSENPVDALSDLLGNLTIQGKDPKTIKDELSNLFDIFKMYLDVLPHVGNVKGTIVSKLFEETRAHFSLAFEQLSHVIAMKNNYNEQGGFVCINGAVVDAHVAIEASLKLQHYLHTGVYLDKTHNLQELYNATKEFLNPNAKISSFLRNNTHGMLVARYPYQYLDKADNSIKTALTNPLPSKQIEGAIDMLQTMTEIVLLSSDTPKVLKDSIKALNDKTERLKGDLNYALRGLRGEDKTDFYKNLSRQGQQLIDTVRVLPRKAKTATQINHYIYLLQQTQAFIENNPREMYLNTRYQFLIEKTYEEIFILLCNLKGKRIENIHDLNRMMELLELEKDLPSIARIKENLSKINIGNNTHYLFNKTSKDNQFLQEIYHHTTTHQEQDGAKAVKSKLVKQPHIPQDVLQARLDSFQESYNKLLTFLPTLLDHAIKKAEEDVQEIKEWEAIVK